MRAESPFTDCTDLIGDRDRLLEHAHQNGYLFFSGLLPAEPVLALRQQVLRVAERHALLAPDTDPDAGIRRSGVFICEQDGSETFRNFYIDVQKLRLFHALPHHERILRVLEVLFGTSVFIHPRHICHIIFPGEHQYTTPPHQDFIPIQGTAETYTAWFPLHDLPPTMGGLEVAAGAHRGGVYNFQPALGAGGLAITDSFEWTGGPFAQGDVLFFHSMMPHRGVPNAGEQLRLSIDARYQRVADPIAPGSLLPHSQPNTWEAIYADWPDDRLQYYWRQYELDVAEYDNSYHEERDRQALELGEQGDPLAVSVLQRIIARDRDPDKRQRAAKLLTAIEEK